MIAEEAEQKRTKLTLNWRGKSERLPDVHFVEVEDGPEPVLRSAQVNRAPLPWQPDYYDRIKALLDRWAEWMAVGGSITEGAPRECPMAPDARIQSFEDMEIEVDKRVVRAVDTCVWELPVLQREAVMRYYGLQFSAAWKADWDKQYDLAIDALFILLKQRISC